MKHLLNILILGFAIGLVQAKEDADITFSYKHSMRNINNYIVISFTNKNKTIIVNETSLEGTTNTQAISISTEQALTINKLYNVISWKNVAPKPFFGLDGHSWSIKSKGILKSVWVPSYNTSERGLEEYLALCLYLLKISGLDNNAMPIK